jgi:hypothetical protein
MSTQFFDRSLSLPASAAQVHAVSSAHDEWQMNDAERATLRSVLEWIRPQCAIEVGVYRAGSLGILAARATKVFALDIDPSCAENYAPRFPNVEFIIGSSVETLPALLQRLQASGAPLDFVLIDGDHSEWGVSKDIRSLLQYRPVKPLYVLLHDSFNPECRRAMERAPWASNPNVHAVELDFVTGRLVGREDPELYGQMWNGLALAVMLPEPRSGGLTVHANDAATFASAYRASIYRHDVWRRPVRKAKKAGKRLRQRLAEVLNVRAL